MSGIEGPQRKDFDDREAGRVGATFHLHCQYVRQRKKETPGLLFFPCASLRTQHLADFPANVGSVLGRVLDRLSPLLCVWLE